VKVNVERVPQSQAVLEVEASPEEMERSLDRAYRNLVKQVTVPGFRKGKAPRNMLERHLGRERLLEEAIEILIPELYGAALAEHKLETIGDPDIEIVKDDPLVFRATVPLAPSVDLGDYRNIRIQREGVEVREEDVDKLLEELRYRYAVHEPVERPVQAGDIVRADVRIVIDGKEVFREDDAQFRVRDGTAILLPGFAEGVTGMAKGETKEIPVTVPEGDRPLSGKSGIATVTVKDVKEERLPELTDDFAREVGEGFESLAALRERLRSDLRERLEAQAEEAYRQKALAALVENAPVIEFPPVLVDREIERLLHDQAHASGMDVEGYLQMIKRSGEQIVQELTPAATERVRRALAVSHLAEKEKIEVSDEEIDAEIESLAGSSGREAEEVRVVLSSTGGRRSVRQSLLVRKTVDRLVEIVSQDGTGGAPGQEEQVTQKASAATGAEEES
jgi:trigger factor